MPVFMFHRSTLIGDFQPKYCIFGRKFSDKKIFSDRLKFREGQLPPPPPPATTPLSLSNFRKSSPCRRHGRTQCRVAISAEAALWAVSTHGSDHSLQSTRRRRRAGWRLQSVKSITFLCIRRATPATTTVYVVWQLGWFLLFLACGHLGCPWVWRAPTASVGGQQHGRFDALVAAIN